MAVTLLVTLLAAPAMPQPSNDESIAATLLINGKYREALPYFTRLIAGQPQNPYHYGNRAECYRHLQEYSLAVQDYDRCIDLYQSYRPIKPYEDVAGGLAWAHLKRGQMHVFLNQDNLVIQDASEAISYYQKSQNRSASKVADAYQLRGDTYHNLGQDVQALQEYNLALRANPQDPYIYTHAGLARLVLGQKAKAQQDFDHALRLDPERKSTIDQMIRFHEQGKRIRLYP